MRRIFLAGLLLALTVDAASARGLQTWVLVCAKNIAKSDCNLTTATKWYHLPSPQASAATPAIKAAKAQVGRTIDAGFYVSQEQFPAGVSMGQRANVFKACASDRAAPTDAEEADWARRGACLR